MKTRTSDGSRITDFNGRRLLCLGNRPKDHRGRDLLLGSLLRDSRLRMFRKQCWKPPAWAPQIPPTVPAKLRPQAQQLGILFSHQQHWIKKLRSTVEAEGGDIRFLDRLADCAPQGAQFERRDSADLMQPCNYARSCPWCHARSVEKLYKRLDAGVCSLDRLRGKHLILARLRISSEMPGTAKTIVAGQRFFDGNLDVLLSDQVKAVKSYWGAYLKGMMHSMGVRNGVTIYQNSPFLLWGDYNEKIRCFCHELTILGELGEYTDSAIEDRQKFMGMLPGTGPPTVSLGGNYGRTTHWGMISAARPHALRYLLFGTSHKFPVRRLSLSVSEYWDTKYGLDGAAALPPWFLFSPTQFWSYLEATQGVRLFDCFGSWRQTRQQEVSTGPSVDPVEDRCQRQRNRSHGLDTRNTERRDEATVRREGLVDVALPIFNRLKEVSGKGPGSPSLRKALDRSGKIVSERDARWLTKHLTEMIDSNGSR